MKFLGINPTCHVSIHSYQSSSVFKEDVEDASKLLFFFILPMMTSYIDFLNCQYSYTVDYFKIFSLTLNTMSKSLFCFSLCVFFSFVFCSWHYFQSVQWISRVWLFATDSMNRSTPGLPVHHQILESIQTHVHWVSDAIQTSHPLSSPSPPAPNPSKH